MMKCKRVFLAAIGAAVIQHAALADSVTRNQHLVLNGISGQGISSSQSYHFSGETFYAGGWQLGAQFDAGLGWLESVDWTATISWTTTSHFSYWQPPGNAGAGLASENWSVQYLRVGSLNLDGKYLSATSGLPTDNSILSVPVGGSVNSDLALTGAITGHMSDSDLLADFVNGTWFYVDTKSRYSASANYAQGGPAPSNLTIDFSYTFNYAPTVVPEPSYYAFAAFIGAAVWAARRRLI